MGLYDAGGQLEKAARVFTAAWYQAKENWSDEKTSAFEERYILPVQKDVRLAIETMTRMATLIEQIRRECSDREVI